MTRHALRRRDHLIHSLARVPNRNGAGRGVGHDKAVGADQAEHSGEDSERTTAVVRVHQNELQAAIVENSAAKLLAAVEADHVLLEAIPLFLPGALLMGDDGSPAVFPQRLDDGIRGEEGVTVAGSVKGMVRVGKRVPRS
jgi:hypothetical protein